jgi:hypothetical protein
VGEITDQFPADIETLQALVAAARAERGAALAERDRALSQIDRLRNHGPEANKHDFADLKNNQDFSKSDI